MNRVAEAGSRIRDFVNDNDLYTRCFAANHDQWHLLCVAMDTLGDTALALQDFEARGFGSEVAGKYLRLYGTLQAVALQQTAIETLYRIFRNDPPPSRPEPWETIREARHLTVAHPLDKRGELSEGKLRVMLSRPTISAETYTLLVFPEKTNPMRVEKIQLGMLYSLYKEEAIALLAIIEDAQRQKCWLTTG